MPAARHLAILTTGVERLIAAGDVEDAVGAVRAFGRSIDALVRSGRVTAEQGGSLNTRAGWAADAMR